jgi:poly(A) polymerase
VSTALGAAGELAIRSLIERAPLASSLAAAFKAEGFTLALVGGPVRDAILGRLGNDLDFTTNATPHGQNIFGKLELNSELLQENAVTQLLK